MNNCTTHPKNNEFDDMLHLHLSDPDNCNTELVFFLTFIERLTLRPLRWPARPRQTYSSTQFACLRSVVSRLHRIQTCAPHTSLISSYAFLH